MVIVPVRGIAVELDDRREVESFGLFRGSQQDLMENEGDGSTEQVVSRHVFKYNFNFLATLGLDAARELCVHGLL